MCTLCHSLTQPEMEYDCENARFSQPGVAPPGLSIYDQKVGRVSGNKVPTWGSLPVPMGAETFLRGMRSLSGTSLLRYAWTLAHGGSL